MSFEFENRRAIRASVGSMLACQRRWCASAGNMVGLLAWLV